MIQYKDYFSRRELFYLGIDSEKEIDGLSKEFYGENRNEAIECVENAYTSIAREFEYFRI